jgi:hypothetical protein
MKRTVQSSENTYSFENVSEGMLIKKDNKELGIYSNFELGENLDGCYLVELAKEFEDEN